MMILLQAIIVFVLATSCVHCFQQDGKTDKLSPILLSKLTMPVQFISSSIVVGNYMQVQVNLNLIHAYLVLCQFSHN